MTSITPHVEVRWATIPPAQTPISAFRSPLDDARRRSGGGTTTDQVANRVITGLSFSPRESQPEPEHIDDRSSDEHATDDPTQ